MKGVGLKSLNVMKVKFIQAWQNVLARSILKPIGQQPQYRGPTPQRRKRGGQWRNITGDAKWTGKKAARNHAKYLTALKQARRNLAVRNAVRHERGDTLAPYHSARAFNRKSLRAIGKAVI